MTSRELTDAIDMLIMMRWDYMNELHRGSDDEELKKMHEKIEIQKRDIADALKRLDHNPGVYQDKEPR